MNPYSCLSLLAAMTVASFPASEPALVLPGEGLTALRVHLEVSPEKIEPDPWAIELGYRSTEGKCAFSLEPSIVSRRGGDRPEISGRKAGSLKPAIGSKKLHAGKEPNAIQVGTYLLKLKKHTESRLPESLVLQFTRDPTDGHDTCEGDLEILGFNFHYERPSASPPAGGGWPQGKSSLGKKKRRYMPKQFYGDKTSMSIIRAQRSGKQQ